MDPGDQRLIDRYLRASGSLSEAKRSEIEELLRTDAGARAYAEHMRSFYELLSEEQNRETGSEVEAFVDELFGEQREVGSGPSPRKTVRPVEPRQQQPPTVLAAESPAEIAEHEKSDERRFSVITTLASDDERLLLRVVGDREAGRGWLYVLSEAKGGGAHALVSFPALDIDLLTGEDGRTAFELPSGPDEEKWAGASAVVRRPVATGTVAPRGEATLSLPSGSRLRCSREEDRLTVTATETPLPPFLAVAPADSAAVPLRLPEEGPARFEIDSEGPLALRVYV